MKTVLTIAGSDPSGGAGLQADLKTFGDFSVRGLSVVTSLTAQNSTKVFSTEPVSAAFVKKQAEALLKEFSIDAVKVGMTGSADNIRAICYLIKKHKLGNVVVDTILKSTSGYPLTDENGLKELKKLIGFAAIATPNIPEASAVTGMNIENIDDMDEAARRVYALGARCVLVKGGHLEGPPVDVLFDGKRFFHYVGRRIKGGKGRFHGTGCILSAAIAAGLANGKSVERAVEDARPYLVSVLKKRR